MRICSFSSHSLLFSDFTSFQTIPSDCQISKTWKRKKKQHITHTHKLRANRRKTQNKKLFHYSSLHRLSPACHFIASLFCNNNLCNSNEKIGLSRERKGIMLSKVTSLVLLQAITTSGAFQAFNLPKIEMPQMFQNTNTITSPSRQQQEADLLQSVSGTQNGKSATMQQQRDILKLVSALETTYPAAPLKEIVDKSPADIDGTWFLQFTCPSELGDVEEEEDTDNWKIENAEENITTQRYEAKGSVSAAGIEVDVSAKPPKQIFDLCSPDYDNRPTVVNEVILPNAFVRVGGPIRFSDKNGKRAVVSFKECKINVKRFGLDLKLDLGWMFDVRALVARTDENGWLETTYLSKDVRIGRGNKGSMFVLTRDEDAVSP